MIYSLIWPDKIVPCVRTTRAQKFVDPAYKKYERWKRAFRLFANTQGFPEDLDLSKAYAIDVKISVIGKSRYDLDNAIKGILDSLFQQDRRVLAITGRIYEREAEESALVKLMEEVHVPGSAKGPKDQSFGDRESVVS